MRRLSRGRGGPVIPSSWAAAHRDVMIGTMTGLCHLHGPDVRADDSPFVEWTPGPLLIETPVPCRVQRINRQQRLEVAEQPVTLADYQVTLPYMPLEIEVGNVVRLTDPDDGDDGTLLELAPLYVTAVRLGTLLWERDLETSLESGR